LSDRKRLPPFIAGTRYSKKRETNELFTIKHRFELQEILSLGFTREKHRDSHLAIEEHSGHMLALCDSVSAMI